MQKRVLAGLPIMAGALVFFGLWIANKLTTPPRKSELNQYIDYKAGPSNPLITIKHTIQASKPGKFTAEMSAGSYSDCIYFSTVYCYASNEFHSSEPLPFPPEDIRCALLYTTIALEKPNWVVYIGYYQDLYTADWIVYESSKSIADPQLKDDLANIGCESLLITSK